MSDESQPTPLCICTRWARNSQNRKQHPLTQDVYDRHFIFFAPQGRLPSWKFFKMLQVHVHWWWYRGYGYSRQDKCLPFFFRYTSFSVVEITLGLKEGQVIQLVGYCLKWLQICRLSVSSLVSMAGGCDHISNSDVGKLIFRRGQINIPMSVN
jgi:hypothetical protein